MSTPTSSTPTPTVTTTSTTPPAEVGFFAELIARFVSPTPTFFAILRNAGLVLGVLSAIPTLLTAVGISIPSAYTGIASKIISAISFATALVSQLGSTTVPATPVETTTTTTMSTTEPTTLSASK